MEIYWQKAGFIQSPRDSARNGIFSKSPRETAFLPKISARNVIFGIALSFSASPGDGKKIPLIGPFPHGRQTFRVTAYREYRENDTTR